MREFGFDYTAFIRIVMGLYRLLEELSHECWIIRIITGYAKLNGEMEEGDD